jgi:geranylgeranyl pyrophosphate synthase
MLQRNVIRYFGKSSLGFVKEFQQRLLDSGFREALYKPDFRSFTSTDVKLQLNLKQLEDTLVTPFWDLVYRESKLMRPILVLIVAETLAVGHGQKVLDLAAFVECLHNTTLIMDDVIDGSNTRRGKPCVHINYGVDTALTCYGFVDHYLIRAIVAKLDIDSFEKKVRIYEAILKCVEELYIGLAWDVAWHKDKSLEMIPSYDNFFHMLELKTSKLLNLATELIGILYDCPQQDIEAIKTALNNFGVSFQLNDDIINIYNEDYSKLKGIGDDIVESKLSFPIMNYITHFSDQPQEIEKLFSAMNVKNKSQSDILRVLELIKSVDCYEAGTLLSRERMNKCYKVLEERFGSESEGPAKLRQLGEYILNNDFLKSNKSS